MGAPVRAVGEYVAPLWKGAIWGAVVERGDMGRIMGRPIFPGIVNDVSSHTIDASKATNNAVVIPVMPQASLERSPSMFAHAPYVGICCHRFEPSNNAPKCSMRVAVTNHDQHVNVVRHADICVAHHTRKLAFDFAEPMHHHQSCIVQMHFAVDDFTEEPHAVLCSNRDEIRARLCVIISSQTNVLAAAHS